RPYPRWGGVALETQHFPDAPHQPAFPMVLLRPGEVFRSSTEFRFGLLSS
ncbi:MAG TPA: galactose-1-epimerase, partial [Caulobacteraceae bacterium]|nr:galactose-1-epimerase [Caulobacteraceae bacterium]